MAQYISSDRLKVAVERLRNSRASGGMVNFLILKRTLTLDPNHIANLSMRDDSFQQAIDELTYWPPDDEADPERPFIDVFGAVNAKNFGMKKKKYRSNGPSDTLRNGTWSSIVEIGEGERSATASLKDNYREDLGRLTILRDPQRPMPKLRDAAVWFFRGRDVSTIVSGVEDQEEIEQKLAQQFCEELGLETEDVAIMFESEAASDDE